MDDSYLQGWYLFSVTEGKIHDYRLDELFDRRHFYGRLGINRSVLVCETLVPQKLWKLLSVRFARLCCIFQHVPRDEP